PGPADDLSPTTLWTGAALLAANNTTTSIEGPQGATRPAQDAAWDPATGRWTRLPAAPYAGYGAVAWTGRELLIWGLLNRTDRNPDKPPEAVGLRLGG